MDLCDVLQAEGYLTPAQSEELRSQSQRSGQPLVAVVATSGHVPEDVIAQVAARKANLPRARLPAAIDRQAAATVDQTLAARYLILPVGFCCPSQGKGVLEVLVGDPFDEQGLRAIQEQASMELKPRVAAYSELVEAIDATYARLVTQVASPMRMEPAENQPKTSPSMDLQEPITVPRYSVLAEATLATKLEALVELLCRSGVIDRETYLEEVRRLWEEREQ